MNPKSISNILSNIFKTQESFANILEKSKFFQKKIQSLEQNITQKIRENEVTISFKIFIYRHIFKIRQI